nr:hypothetical protein [Tanacetum cinerariifolium]
MEDVLQWPGNANMAFDLRPTEDVLSWPDNANMAFDLRLTEGVLPWPGNANMAFDLWPTGDVLPWPGNANMAFDLRPTEDQAEHELLQTTRDFHSCKQEEGQSVSSYVLKMKGYIDNLERLGHPVTLGLGGLRASRKLKPGALSLYVGNGQRETVEAIGAFYLCLPSGLEIVLNNCHYAPSITRRVISVSRLYEDGFVNRFVDNTIQVSRNNVVYFSAVPRDGIFKIDLSNSLTNESSIYAVSNKRAKIDLDSALLWHCRLGHISKKRIEKLQHDGLFNSSDLRACEKCVSCMSGKMARKPYTHQVERAKDLLGLIHTNVCSPFKIMSRQGASYFITFTDDFSRYGYAYLLKHKHEVFKTFKVFQKEVENQLGKTIKSLRCNRGGEYMSQEFLDHLKDHEIIAHRTPPYTPQHNDTSLNHEEDDLEINEPQSDIVLIRRSTRTRHVPDRMCLYIDAEEHKLGDLGEPANYKAALLDPESEKWLNAMNVEMQSMKDNEM